MAFQLKQNDFVPTYRVSFRVAGCGDKRSPASVTWETHVPSLPLLPAWNLLLIL